MSIPHDAKLSPSTRAMVLTAGDGSRLSTLTRDSAAVPVPKQFCSLKGGVTLLTIESLLHANVEIAKQRQLIATLIQENELLRQRLGDRTDFDLSADPTPALCRKQAG